jgi:hypothetical protein
MPDFCQWPSSNVKSAQQSWQCSERRVQAGETKFFRAVEGWTKEGRIKTDRIRSEFQIYLINEKIYEARDDWR